MNQRRRERMGMGVSSRTEPPDYELDGLQEIILDPPTSSLLPSILVPDRLLVWLHLTTRNRRLDVVPSGGLA
eukprot:CAMPEP_0172310436 /NCGR_PEP_ID=MMETSP1058-20130122/11486_1 /TAXON_ID=83371 /ORGANISM="Detonula confervacea, Strain CCMP 353" /LENGTH=71 /DNA_ID=CAMNT_0013023243 /DNA_START=279 /DNA_END=491 /DNA_ORIENTATION=-